MPDHSPDAIESPALSPRLRGRPGIALAIALGAIVIVGALVAAGYYASLSDYRTSHGSLSEPAAIAAAELGLNSTLASWTSARTFALKVGRDSILPDTTLPDGTILRKQWKKLSPTMFWVVATANAGGQSSQSRSRRTLNALIHIQIPEVQIIGAVTSRGTTTVSGNDSLNGQDAVPTNWSDCPPPGSTAAALVVHDSATTTSTSGTCSGANCMSGNPKIKDSTALVKDTMSFTNFGGFNYDSLTKLATMAFNIGPSNGYIWSQVYPRTNGSVCDFSQALNWGDTAHVALGLAPGPCESYYPIIWLKGATSSWTLNNEGGQGVLLIDGNAKFAGTFKWTGLIIVRGTVTVQGNSSKGGVKIFGALLAMNRAGGTNSFSGAATVQFSRCAIQTVTSRYATAAPARYRAWADMY